MAISIVAGKHDPNRPAQSPPPLIPGARLALGADQYAGDLAWRQGARLVRRSAIRQRRPSVVARQKALPERRRQAAPLDPPQQPGQAQQPRTPATPPPVQP